MAKITLKGNPIETVGELPQTGSKAPDFTLVASDLSERSLQDYRGKRVVLNIFPSVDTPTCATSVRQFNQQASASTNTVVLCISKDLPFALARFCGAEGLDEVESLSAFRADFGSAYGVEMRSGPLHGLLSRAVVVLDTEGKVLYRQQVPEIADEPDYDAAMAALD